MSDRENTVDLVFTKQCWLLVVYCLRYCINSLNDPLSSYQQPARALSCKVHIVRVAYICYSDQVLIKPLNNSTNFSVNTIAGI